MQHGFGVIFEPVDAVAFEALVDDAADARLDCPAADRNAGLSKGSVPHARRVVDEVVHGVPHDRGATASRELVDVRQQDFDLTFGKQRFRLCEPLFPRRLAPGFHLVGDGTEALDGVRMVDNLAETLWRQTESLSERGSATPYPFGAVAQQGHLRRLLCSHEPQMADQERIGVVAVAHRAIEEGAVGWVFLAVLADDIDGQHLRLAPRSVVSAMPGLRIAPASFRVLAHPQSASIDSDGHMLASELASRRLFGRRSRKGRSTPLEGLVREHVGQPQGGLVGHIEPVLAKTRTRYGHGVRVGDFARYLRTERRCGLTGNSERSQCRTYARARLTATSDASLEGPGLRWRCDGKHGECLKLNHGPTEQPNLGRPATVRLELHSGFGSARHTVCLRRFHERRSDHPMPQHLGHHDVRSTGPRVPNSPLSVVELLGRRRAKSLGGNGHQPIVHRADQLLDPRTQSRWKFRSPFHEGLRSRSGSRAKRKPPGDLFMRSRPGASLNQRSFAGSLPDDTGNVAYPILDARIAETYAAHSNATLAKGIYDSYVRAIRWASDRVGKRGIVGFVTNANFIEANTADGLRKCLASEFSSLYIFHLRGNQRTAGERSKKEGGKVFGSGSRAPVAISILVKNPAAPNNGKIRFYDVGDYLTREEKLAAVSAFKDIAGIGAANAWTEIVPDAHGDWLKQRDDTFANYIALGIKDKNDPTHLRFLLSGRRDKSRRMGVQSLEGWSFSTDEEDDCLLRV